MSANRSLRAMGMGMALWLVAAVIPLAATAQSGRAPISGLIEWEMPTGDCANVPEGLRVELSPLPAQPDLSPAQATLTPSPSCGAMLYDFGQVPMGRYSLRMSADGYRTYETPILVPSDAATSLHVYLEAGEGADPCEGADAAAFNVHGLGTPAGVVRYFRPGALFSDASSEGGSVSLYLGAVGDGGLAIRRETIGPIWDTETPAQVETLEIPAAEDGSFHVEHLGGTTAFVDHTVVQRGVYRVEAVSDECYRVTTTEPIPPYEGE